MATVRLLPFHLRSDRLARWTAAAWMPPAAAALLAATYVVAFLIPFPLLTWYDYPQTNFAIISHSEPLAAARLALAGLVLVVLCRQMGSFALAHRGRAVLITIVAGWLAASAVLLFTYPGQSTDLGDYVFRAHMLTHLGQNPLTTPPSALIPLEDFPYLAWHAEVDPYGPLWQALAGLTHSLAGESYLANLIAFKLLALAATGLAGLLIFVILRSTAPDAAAAGLALWLWNPLVLNQGALDGHNDVIMIALVLAALGLLLRERFVSGLIALALAGLVKITAWILVPVAAVWILRRRGWRSGLPLLAVGLTVGAALVWLAYEPFGGLARLIDLARNRSWWPADTWTAAIFFALRDGQSWPHETVVTLVTGSASALFVVLALVLIYRLSDLRSAAWAVALAYLLVGTLWLQPWYAALLVALAAIKPDRRLVDYTLLLTCCMLLSPILSQYWVSTLTLPPGGRDALMATAVLLVPQLAAVRLAWPRRARQ